MRFAGSVHIDSQCCPAMYNDQTYQNSEHDNSYQKHKLCTFNIFVIKKKHRCYSMSIKSMSGAQVISQEQCLQDGDTNIRCTAELNTCQGVACDNADPI